MAFRLMILKSGLAAYLYAAPNVELIDHSGIIRPNENMKKFIISHAWTRVPPERLLGRPNLDVVYNLARGDRAHSDNPCAISELGKRAESVSACLISQSSTAMSTSTTSPVSSRYV